MFSVCCCVVSIGCSRVLQVVFVSVGKPTCCTGITLLLHDVEICTQVTEAEVLAAQFALSSLCMMNSTMQLLFLVHQPGLLY